MSPGFGGRPSDVTFFFAFSVVALACGSTKIDPAMSLGDVSSSGPAADSTTGAGTTHAALEPCEAHLTAPNCDAAGCIWFASERVVDLATCALSAAGFCATASGSTADEAHDSAFYKRVGGVLQLHRVGLRSCERSGTAHPHGWTECGVGPGDPPECGCVCAGGRCPGDLALDALEACAMPTPCADIDGDWRDPACVYQALATRARARLRVHIERGARDIDQRVYLRGDGSAQWIHSACGDDCFGCTDRAWDLPRTCTLRDPAYFAACAASDDPAVLAACRDLSTWFTDCALAPATCL